MSTSHEERTIEYAVGSNSRPAATSFRCCAKQLGLPLEVVVRAAQTGRLAGLIEKRSGRNPERRNLSRIDWLYRRRELAAKQVPPW